MNKKGDTLVEVTLAIGIFSMIAIAIASVMNGGVSDAQTALETTLTREQIDTQAEALRFIHSSYINYRSFNNTDNPYVGLWKRITDDENAIDLDTLDADIKDSIINFAPESCDDLYDNTKPGSILNQHAFVINTRAMGEYINRLNNHSDDTDSSSSNADAERVVQKVNYSNIGTDEMFRPTSTYPQLIYGVSDSSALASDAYDSNLYSAEGIYIIAVKDSGTELIDGSGDSKSVPAFYDFYIRTCWYGARGNNSTISTVIRLNDPNKSTPKRYVFNITTHNDDNSISTENGISSYYLKNPGSKSGADGDLAFVGWCDHEVKEPGDRCDGKLYSPGMFYGTENGSNSYELWPTWRGNFWVDVNNFIYGDPGTSGHDGFLFEAYLDGEPILCDSNSDAKARCNAGASTGDPNLIDFYRPVPDETPLKFIFKDVPGYYLSNQSSICSTALQSHSSCTVTKSGSNYIVELKVSKNARATNVDLSGNLSLQIEPIWKKR